MLFCSDGCISVVDKRTVPLCFVFYTEREEKNRSYKPTSSRKRQRSTQDAIYQYSSGILVYSTLEMQAHKAILITLLSFREGVWSFSAGISPLQSHFSDPGGEEDSTGPEAHQKERCALSPTLFSLGNPVFPHLPFLITQHKLKQFPFRVKDGGK